MKPNVEPMRRSRAKHPTPLQRELVHKRGSAPPPTDHAKRRADPVNWACIKALHRSAAATCTAYREDMTGDLAVWRIVLAVKVPKGISNSLVPTAARAVYNIPLLSCQLDHSRGLRGAQIKGAFLLRGPERGEDLLVIKTTNCDDALELIAGFDPDRAVALHEAICAEQGYMITVKEGTRETLPNSAHAVFGVQGGAR